MTSPPRSPVTRTSGLGKAAGVRTAAASAPANAACHFMLEAFPSAQRLSFPLWREFEMPSNFAKLPEPLRKQ